MRIVSETVSVGIGHYLCITKFSAGICQSQYTTHEILLRVMFSYILNIDLDRPKKKLPCNNDTMDNQFYKHI